MITINYSELRNSLKENLDMACETHEAIVVQRPKGKSVVMLSLDDYKGMAETAYLLSTKANAARLAKSIKQAKKGNLISYDPTL
jgi:antitoxin YefM